MRHDLADSGITLVDKQVTARQSDAPEVADCLPAPRGRLGRKDRIVVVARERGDRRVQGWPLPVLVRFEQCDVNLDIGWIREVELRELIEAKGAIEWFMFLVGRSIHDPAGAADRSQRLIRDWYDRHPDLLEAWKQQQVDVEKHKRDRGHKLLHDTQPKFCAHLGDHLS